MHGIFFAFVGVGLQVSVSIYCMSLLSFGIGSFKFINLFSFSGPYKITANEIKIYYDH